MWTLVPKPKGYKPITCKWVYRVKLKSESSLDKYKSCLVAKGYKQKYGMDYSETFFRVVKPQTIQLVLTISLILELDIKLFNVNNAFLNGNLEEEVYMCRPQGFENISSPNLVCKLNKALYGLKQALRAWL